MKDDALMQKMSTGEDISTDELRNLLGDNVMQIADTLDIDDLQKLLKYSFKQASDDIQNSEEESEVLMKRLQELQGQFFKDEVNGEGLTEENVMKSATSPEQVEDIFAQQQQQIQQALSTLQDKKNAYQQLIPQMINDGDIYT